jgi:hypothetical protein
MILYARERVSPYDAVTRKLSTSPQRALAMVDSMGRRNTQREPTLH